MKKIILIISLLIMLLGIAGCADKRIILVPQSEYYPTFNISDFNKSKKYHINMWVETKDVNNTTKTYLVTEENDMIAFIKNVKELRANYNVLLKEINKFNQKIKELNKIQSQKTPREVETIDNSWFK